MDPILAGFVGYLLLVVVVVILAAILIAVTLRSRARKLEEFCNARAENLLLEKCEKFREKK